MGWAWETPEGGGGKGPWQRGVEQEPRELGSKLWFDGFKTI